MIFLTIIIITNNNNHNNSHTQNTIIATIIITTAFIINILENMKLHTTEKKPIHIFPKIDLIQKYKAFLSAGDTGRSTDGRACKTGKCHPLQSKGKLVPSSARCLFFD